ncbi:MAG: hypothetical protein WBH31_09610 [Promethearchaeia archaeon]
MLSLNFIFIRSLPVLPPNAFLSATPSTEYYWKHYEYYEAFHTLPLWQQFFLYLGNLFTGNWGYTINVSFLSPVKELILERIYLYMIILIIPICIVLFFDIRSSFKESDNRGYRKLIRIILLLIFSIPSFLIVIFINFLGNEIPIELFTQLIIATLILSLSLLSKMTFIKRRDMLNNYDPSNYAIRKSNRS